MFDTPQLTELAVVADVLDGWVPRLPDAAPLSEDGSLADLKANCRVTQLVEFLRVDDDDESSNSDSESSDDDSDSSSASESASA